MRRNTNQYLNIKGTVLDNEQLRSYMEKIGTNHNLKISSDKNTYPISRLKDNFKFIERTYNLLNEDIKIGINVIPAGEWLLDNFYVIEETMKTVIKELTPEKYRKFPGLANGLYTGYARIYVLASEIAAYTDSRINHDTLKLAISAYQRRKTLSMEEIWSLWMFLDIAIIESIRDVCERIYTSQMQRYKVESIVERLVENKEHKDWKYGNVGARTPSRQNPQSASLTAPLSKGAKLYKGMSYPFIEYMSYRLKQYGKKALPYLNVLEDQINKMGMTTSEAIQKEHFDMAIRESEYWEQHNKHKRNFKA